MGSESVHAVNSPKRPWWCQDPTCTPMENNASDDVAMGGFCAGRMAQERETERFGFVHKNDCHFCIRSPARGVVMLEVNQGDFEVIGRITLRSLLAINPSRKFSVRWYLGDVE